MNTAALYSQRGMTLIELSIALILFSLLILPVFIMQNKQAETEKRGKTIATLSTLDAALERFVITHGRYPMPGQRNLDLNDPEAGREFSGEVDDLKECGPDTAEVCTLSSLIDDGNPNTDDLKEAAVLRGEFPYATLGLPPTAVLDGFGNKITYFITSAQTKNATYENDGGQIQIRNKANPDEILMAGDKVHFALMSAGPNGVGAYTLHGALRTTCGGGADEADDDEGGAGEEESAGPGNGPDNGPGETGINCVHPKEENKVLARLFQNVGESNTGNGVFRDVLMSYGTEEFDDYLQFANSDTSQLWTRDTGTNDILSKTSGNVRIGQDRIYPVKNPAGFIPVDDQPAAKIEVMGHVSANVLQAPRLCPMEVQGEDTLCDDREIENGIIPQNFFTSALMTQPFDPYADGGKAGQGIHCQSSKTGDDKWATKGFTSLGKVDEKCDYDKIEDLSGTKCKTDEWAYGYDPVKKTFLCTNKSLYGKLEANNLDQYTCADCTNNGGGPGGSGGAGTGGAGTGGAGTGGAGAGGPKK